MERLRIRPILLAVVSVVVFCAPMAAQSVREVSPVPAKSKDIHPTGRSVPFSTRPDDSTKTIEFRSADQMTETDRNLLADAQSSISEHAGFLGEEFNGGKWNYQQVLCPALPNHIFLRFTRNNGTGDVSVFSASIPRNVDGRVRIIPIQLRGYSLFSPAPINALTISAFNHIRAEEHFEAAPEWLGTALCYGALAGGNPVPALMPKEPQDKGFPVAMPAIMQIPNHGGAILRFADVAATPRPMQWTMTFDDKDKLLKATHSPAALVKVKALPQRAEDVKGKPIPQTVMDFNARQTR